MPLEEIRKARLEKLAKLKKAGIDPYPARTSRTHMIVQATGDGVLILAGRVMAIREHGAITFMDLRDGTGQIQLFFDKEKPTEVVDIGDFLEVEGTLFTTKAGEKTLKAISYKLLAKSLLPLPEKWHGLQDVEERYRKRYLDLIMNAGVREVLVMRSKIVEVLRRYFVQRGYLEVQTPVLQPLYGGGSARPFVSHLNALDMNVYLRIANELYLKRLVVGGLEKVFEFSIDFRNEGIDRSHNPEFMLFEAMIAYEDYEFGMQIIEDSTEHVVKTITGGTKVTYQSTELDFKKPWKRVSYAEALQTYGAADIKQCETHFVQPTILYDYPAETSPLAKRKGGDPSVVERFEQYAAGMEIGNNYSELNDPQVLAENWKQQEEKLKKGDEEAQRMDKDFIEALEVGMPPTCGIAISIDRLTMLLTNQHSIRDVIPFPFMRPMRDRKLK